MLFIIDLHIFLYTDSHFLIMLWKTFEETTDRVCTVLAFRLSLFSYYNKKSSNGIFIQPALHQAPFNDVGKGRKQFCNEKDDKSVSCLSAKAYI